jgi:hypothetical protein
MQPGISGENAPKLDGPVSIIVRNFWVFNLCGSKAKVSSEVWDFAVFIAGEG